MLLLYAAALLIGACDPGSSSSSTVPAATAVSSDNPPVAPIIPIIDLDVDTNRNGTVEDADEQGEDGWSALQGAVFYANRDDDDGDKQEDSNDSIVNGSEDLKDIVRIIVRKYPPAPTDGKALISVEPAAAQDVLRVFRNDKGSWTSLYTSGPSFLLPMSDIAGGDIELGIEARSIISPLWNGGVTVTLTLLDFSDQSLGADTVYLRCAPWLMATNLWPIEQLHVVDVGSSNLAFRTNLQNVCASTGIQYKEIPGSSYAYDRWIQDSSEPGILYLPASDAPRRRIDSVLQCARWRPVDKWCKDALLGKNFDWIARFSTNQSSMNYGGNLEIIPPHTAPDGSQYPWGRILVGGGSSLPIGGGSAVTRHMIQSYRDFFNALKLQGPYLEVSTEWLAVGHVDEHTMPIKAPASPKGWALALASPILAKQILENVQTAGGGSLAIFQGRGKQTTVNAVLSNTSLMLYNLEVQGRMDAIRQFYKTNIGLTDADIVDLPVLYENSGSWGAVAYNPNPVNMAVLPAVSGAIHLVVPDPEGPDQPTDAWAAETKQRLEALGTTANPVTVTFTDVYESYHVLMGEVHCGINTVRTPPAEDWWDD